MQFWLWPWALCGKLAELPEMFYISQNRKPCYRNLLKKPKFLWFDKNSSGSVILKLTPTRLTFTIFKANINKPKTKFQTNSATFPFKFTTISFAKLSKNFVKSLTIWNLRHFGQNCTWRLTSSSQMVSVIRSCSKTYTILAGFCSTK